MRSIQAVYENGVFRPVEPVNLPEHTAVEVEFHAIGGREPPAQVRSLSRHAGILKSLPVDPREYQREVRKEWE